MHILIGALLGGAISAAITVAVALAVGRKVTLKDVLLAAASGAVGGAITAATLGAGAGVFAGTTASLGRQVGAGALGGAVAGGSERVGHNALEGRALGDQVLERTAAGAVTGGAFPVARAAVAPIARRALGATRSALGDLGARIRGRGPSSTAADVEGVAGPGIAGAARPGATTTTTTTTATGGSTSSASTPTTTLVDSTSAPRTSGIVHALDADAARGASRPAAASTTETPTTTTTTTTNATTTVASEPPGGGPRATTTTTTTTTTSTARATPEAPAAGGKPRGPTWDEVMARGAARGYRSVHAAPPAWLEARIASTVDAVRRGAAGPQANGEDVERFLRETAEHVDEVNALVKALGGRPREVPAELGASGLRGVHDFGERASLRRVDELVDSLRRTPVRDKDGVPLEVPAWLANLTREARARGETTVDVGKLSPHVAAGLGRAGPPDPFAIRLHNLAGHHAALSASESGRPSAALIETIADKVNAMRQARIYRPEPMPFAKIEQLLTDDVAAGRLPPEADGVIRRALELQARLEREGVVNPYHLLSPATADMALGAP